MFGALINESPILCGNSQSVKKCYRYDLKSASWLMRPYFVAEERIHSAGATFGNDSWIITGGQKYVEGAPILLDTSEVLDNGSFVSGPRLPLPLSDHCAISIAKDAVFISGGYGQPQHLKEAFILKFNPEPNWIPLHNMQYGKFGHACGKVITLFNETEIITAGGLRQDKVEIYLLDKQFWINGPQIKSRQIFKVATIQARLSFVLTGGVELEPNCTNLDCRLDSIYLYDSSENEWKESKKSLKRARGNHVAVSLPTEADCSSN